MLFSFLCLYDAFFCNSFRRFLLSAHSLLVLRSSFFVFHSLILIINDDACLTSKQLNSLATCIITIKNYCFSIIYVYEHTHTRSVHWLFLNHFKFHSRVCCCHWCLYAVVVFAFFNFHVDDGLTNEPRKRRTLLFFQQQQQKKQNRRKRQMF